jgi:protein-S-isoprenylcysteine O-methyltransferase Ste14
VARVRLQEPGHAAGAPALALTTFGKPSSGATAIGLPIAFLGEALRCWAVGYSGVTTRGDTVTAPALVTAGPYAYMRNPLYLGNFMTALGFSLAFTGGLEPRSRAALIALGLGTMAGVYATIVPLEEEYLRRTFGAEFEDYVARCRARSRAHARRAAARRVRRERDRARRDAHVRDLRRDALGPRPQGRARLTVAHAHAHAHPHHGHAHDHA